MPTDTPSRIRTKEIGRLNKSATRTVATGTADSLEYQGLGWMDADSNQKYAAVRVSTDEHPLCPVCEMEVDPSSAPSSAYQGRTYYFCMADHKSEFDAKPDKYIHA